MADSTTQYISPRQLARAAGVSESSVKRWCDQGLIATVKTAGGHRRLTLDAATEFLRQSGADAKPEHLGLPARVRVAGPSGKTLVDEFLCGLRAADDTACQRMLIDLHLRGESVSRLGDQVIGPAFQRIGREWECHELEVYQERSACGVCLRAIERLRALVPVPPSHAPLALGGTPDSDPYAIATSLVELTLRQVGYNTRSLGSRLPFATLAAAVRVTRPQIFWLSVSHIDDDAQFLAGYRSLYDQVQEDVAVVVGGQALTDSIRQQMQYAAFCDNLQHLESFAKSLRRSHRQAAQVSPPARRSTPTKSSASNRSPSRKPPSGKAKK